jgi:hypothetical protein
MKSFLKKSSFFAFLVCTFCSLHVKSQDTIVKTNGEIIAAKITEVGTNAITYKKANLLDGPTFIDYKTDIVYVKFSNGQKQFFAKEIPAQIQKSMIDTNLVKKNEMQKTDLANSNGMNKIETLNGKFTINGQKASRKDVNNLLGKSKNPAVIAPLKLAKTTKTFQKIIKITSIPTTIGGGSALLWTGVGMYNDVKRGRDNTSTYIGTLTSLLTTVTFPITSRILKNKSDKMYNKLIDMYNITN